jgi:nucleotide-binding universal stress UspA family protein
MHKIVVPIDFSETAGAALRFGTFLAEVMDLDLHVVHVLDAKFSLAQAVSTGALLAEKERLEEKLSEFVKHHAFPVLATFQANIANLPKLTKEVLEGIPSGIIRTLSEREEVELMVMGGVGAGQRTTSQVIFGGVARGLALGGSCPVILIPSDYGYPKVKNLALAFGDTEDIRQMGGLVSRLVEVLRPEVSLVHVESSDSLQEMVNQEALIDMEQTPDFPTYSFSYHALPAGPVVKQLLRYIDEEKIDLLVLGGKRRQFWDALFAGSSLKPMVNRCGVPLLVIPLVPPSL